MGISAVALAAIVSATAAAAGTALSVKERHDTAKSGEKASKEAKKRELLARKEKELKSPGQRLLGGRPTLG